MYKLKEIFGIFVAKCFAARIHVSFLVLLSWSLNFSNVQSQNGQSSLGISFCHDATNKGFRFNGTVRRQLHALSGIDCILLCIKNDPCCRSVNYRKKPKYDGGKNCELLSTVASEQPKDLKTDENYNYYILLQPKRSFDCHCSSCKNNGTCVENSKNCSCLSGFFGKQCEQVYSLERNSLQFKGNNIKDYAQTIGAPSMTEMTVSFFLKTNMSRNGFLVSYAVPERDNEFLIYFETNSMRVLLMYSTKSPQGTSIRFKNITINDGIWHHVCFMWESKTGAYSIYKDGVPSGGGINSYTINKSLSGHGTWVLGQDQDSVGGGFDPNQAFQGEIAEVNIWDKVLSKPENLALLTELLKGCKSTLTGNVKAWNDFISGVKGDVKVSKSTYC